MSRFRDPPDPIFERLNASIGFDRRLAPYDIELSRAHVRILEAAGILTTGEAEQLMEGLDGVAREVAAGEFAFHTGDEDVHMAIERRLTELVGPLGGKLHTARSRNDQVATDVAMFVRAQCGGLQERVRELMRVLLGLAERHADWPMPGYTHLQRAQPLYLSQHLLAYFWMLRRDLDRFDFCSRQASVLALGSGALAGVNWDTDRGLLATELGFESIAPNSLDAVSNRDFVLDFLSAAAICAMHLSRLGTEVILWSSEEFGFLELSDAFSSGSSIMPQKKNADAAELLRAKAPRIAGHLSALLGVFHGLPLAYNKDMQEDKEHLFDSVDTLDICLQAAAGMMATASFRRERLAAAASDELLAATDVADLLVRKGVPFREAHAIVGGVVRYALEQGKRLSELKPEELARFSAHLGQDYYDLLAPRRSIEAKLSEGGTASVRVEEQLGQARAVLEEVLANAEA